MLHRRICGFASVNVAGVSTFPDPDSYLLCPLFLLWTGFHGIFSRKGGTSTTTGQPNSNGRIEPEGSAGDAMSINVCPQPITSTSHHSSGQRCTPVPHSACLLPPAACPLNGFTADRCVPQPSAERGSPPEGANDDAHGPRDALASVRSMLALLRIGVALPSVRSPPAPPVSPSSLLYISETVTMIHASTVRMVACSSTQPFRIKPIGTLTLTILR